MKLKMTNKLLESVINSKVIFICFVFQIPVVLNAGGGILVGLITTYAGGVKKASVIHLYM